MKPFKFLSKNPLIRAHDGGYIYAGDVFYSMNKDIMESVIRPGEYIPKYTIVRRCVNPMYSNLFKPDYDVLWYFKSKQNAEYLRTLWMNEDRINEIGETFHRQAEVYITLNRQ
jgi:hypothetical protein